MGQLLPEMGIVDESRFEVKNYTKKKLGYAEVHRVISKRGVDYQVLRGIREPYVIDGVPEGCFALCKDGILLPKRKRGEKFIVNYTVMMEKVL